MIAGTLFSGIGAPEAAMPHWRWAWCAEIDRFPAAVLAARHPESVNLGDVTADDFVERASRIARPDVLVFGSPCQSYSVAGKRLGLDDPRGNMALVALGIVGRLKPDWFVFENVPGLLSSSEGRDFGLFLRAVDELGYFGAWASLDAQYFGVAQRRERLFFVGNSRDWRYSAAVLFEPEGVLGHHSPRRETWEDVVPTIASRPTGGGGLGTDFDCDGGLIAPELAWALQERDAKGADSNTKDGHLIVAHSLRADGFDASEDGTGRGTPLIAFDARQSDVIQYGDKTGPLDTDGTSIAVAFAENQRTELTTSDTVGALASGGGKPGQGYPAVAFQTRIARNGRGQPDEVVPALNGADAGTTSDMRPCIATPSMVRRLLPVECEKLQGFEPGYTAITYRGKPAADGPRYKALGNSMAVPVVRWILLRIEMLSVNEGERLAARSNGE